MNYNKIKFDGVVLAYYYNEQWHRLDGPAIEWKSGGDTQWRIKGKLHREDGPAVITADGTKKWYLNGKLNRLDGPAIEYSNGSKEWYIDGIKISNKR